MCQLTALHMQYLALSTLQAKSALSSITRGQEPAATSDTPPARAYAFNLQAQPFACLLIFSFFHDFLLCPVSA